MHPTSTLTASGAKTGSSSSSDSYTERGTTGSLCYCMCCSAAHVLPQHVASLGNEMCHLLASHFAHFPQATLAPSAAAAAAGGETTPLFMATRSKVSVRTP